MKVCLVCGEVIETLSNTGCPYCGATEEEIAEEDDDEDETMSVLRKNGFL